MSDTTFVSKVTVVLTTWLQNVNNYCFRNSVVFSTYADIRANTYANARAGKVRGRLSDSDGCAGEIYLDTSDVTTPDTEGLVWVDTLGGRWKRKYSGEVDIRWCGAKCDGSTNDATAVQVALNSGNSIVIPKGTTTIVNTMCLFKADYQIVNLFGTLKTTSGITALLQSTDYSYTGIVGNGVVDGNNIALNCVQFLADATNPVGCFVDGITVKGTANDPTLFLGGIVFNNTAGAGGSFRNKDVRVTNCQVRNCGTHGVLIVYSDGVTVEGNVFDTTVNHGHESVGCTDVNICGNTAQNCTMSGVGVGASTRNFLITGNVVSNCGGDGSITCEHNSVFGTIAGNTIYDCNTAGINVSYGTAGAAPFDKIQNVVVSGNSIRAKSGVTTYQGINVYSTTGAGLGGGIVVTNNTIDKFNRGITYAYCSDGCISFNVIRNLTGSSTAAIVGTLISRVDITGNKCDSDTADHSIQVLSYLGTHSNMCNISNNFIYASGTATKALVYIDGNGVFTVTGNNTSGALHYVLLNSTATALIGENFGNLAGASYSGGTFNSSIGSSTASTVGAAGAASALPANPLGYVVVNAVGVGQVKVPYYNN